MLELLTSLAGFALTAVVAWAYCRIMNARLDRSHAEWMAEQRATEVK